MDKFNENFRRLRKERNITQEQLAAAVGVTPQAVSKWETAGYPDALLLPEVARFLGVTIDELYGVDDRDNKTLNQVLVEHFHAMGESYDMKFSSAMELCRAMLQGFMNCFTYVPLDKHNFNAKDWDNYSEFDCEQGFMQSRNNENLQYFLLMPEPPDGYDDFLAYDESMVSFFGFLSQPCALKALYYIARKGANVFITSRSLVNELNTTAENADKIIEGLVKFGLVRTAGYESEDEKIYVYRGGANIISFLTFTRTLMNLPVSFSYQSNARDTPYMKKTTYKKGQNDEKKG